MKVDKRMLENVDTSLYDVKVTERLNSVNIELIRKKQVCSICNSVKHYKHLQLRQDSRVKLLIVPKKVCNTCLPQVNLIIKNLKDSVMSPMRTGKW